MHGSRIAPGGVAAISVVAILVVMSLATTLTWWLRRRRLQSRAMNRVVITISPFTLITEVTSLIDGNATADDDSYVRGVSTSTIERQRLEMELLAATEKMLELEERTDSEQAIRGGGRAYSECGSSCRRKPLLQDPLRIWRHSCMRPENRSTLL
ncbi:hypothetical protein K438DRAFT_1970743 [Mycena galopus ATCC 62051]|nr:hypothetical protein K438DRAFT_1970743 [Mycena galopus ATCC 62051]